ncbi:hypothetical protein GCM10012289_73720 [Nonomuraea cavernae]|uniref:Uncharacterized protein n=1 Tax=Nonomuraea cavernae TaxID=2045107 RepID=A0A918DSR2_9ACTN|nr:hypothetical protein GCM10012289_73720 [Nonomuraea cavernae]
MDRTAAERFARRQRVDLTIFNGDRILLYLQVRRRYRWLGAATGLVCCVATFTQGAIVISAYLPLAGWLLGSIVAEIGFARSRPRVRRRLDVRLAPPRLTSLWRLGASISVAVALSAVARSYGMEVGVRERLYAVLTLGVVLTVHLIVRDLHRRALVAGPADLVGAELAIRSGSARSLLATGTTIALWTASGSLPDLPDLGQPAVVLIALGLPLLVLGTVTDTWQVTYALSGRPAWPAPAATLLAAALTATPLVWAPREAGETRLDNWYALPHARFADLDQRSGAWRLWGPEGGIQVGQARAYLSGDGTAARPAPLALSGDGRHVVYLDRASRRLVLAHLLSRRERHLTGPLADEAVPEPALSHDGRHVSLTTAAGVELIDATTGARTPLPGVRRVLGLGPDGGVATTGLAALPGAPDTELVTFDHSGKVRTRVRFDPTLRVRLSPDGRTLAVVTRNEIVTMDPGTGEVRGRARLRLPTHPDAPEPLGWDEESHVLVRIDRYGQDKGTYHLVDPVTGKSRPLRDIPDDLWNPVFGKVPSGEDS